jgi:hypothetical protein
VSLPFPPCPFEGTTFLVKARFCLPLSPSRYFQATLGEQVPRLETAVVWGTGDFNFRRALDIQQMRKDLKRAEVLREELRRDIALCERHIKELGDQTVRKERGT